MRGRFLSGFTTGTIIGTIVGMMMVPKMSYRGRRRVSNASRRVGELINELRHNLR